MNHTRRADALVAQRLRAAARAEPLPGRARGTTAAELAASISAGSAHTDRFQDEIATAVRGTALALAAARPHPPDLWQAADRAHTDPTVWFEQAVVLGHPAHPLARTRGILTDAQIRAFAPEHAPRFDLGRYALEGVRSSADWPDAGLVPVHPWQAQRHRLPGPTRTWEGAAPLMSLRTVSVGSWHVKCAVDLQLTSAVRHVSAAAASNGPALSALIAPPAHRCAITLIPEQSAIPTGPTGAHPHLAAIIRPAPHTLAGTDRIVPLAALAEPCPATGRPIGAAIAAGHLDQWWHELCTLLSAPLRLFETTGIALEAHGQNTLVAFDGDRPARLLYRDLGGVRVPAADWPTLAGDIQTDDEDERTRKLLAALLPTTVTALVEAFATWTGTDPGRWWHTLAERIRDTIGPRLAQTVLTQDWPAKATCAMRLADRPNDDIWTTAANPMADA